MNDITNTDTTDASTYTTAPEIERLEEKVDINKRQEDFFKVEHFEIVLSRLEVLEQNFKKIQESIIPALENLQKLLEPIPLIMPAEPEDLPSEVFVPPLPEPTIPEEDALDVDVEAKIATLKKELAELGEDIEQ
jgi:hypothetical protein